jgi:CRP-like cAMP-binding protein
VSGAAVLAGCVQQTGKAMSITDDTALPDGTTLVRAALSSALVPIFRGKFCDILLPNRDVATFDKHEVIYELGAEERTFFFIRRGVAKIGTITDGGREIIYDIRKDGDVLGELCALESPRRDRAVAVERTEAVPVAFNEVVGALARRPALLGDFLGIFCSALSEAYDQVNRLALNSVLDRLTKTLKILAHKLGRPSGNRVEIAAYLTQEELSQMVVARRERVSTALNSLRRRGILQYSPRGHLLLDMRALDRYASRAK